MILICKSSSGREMRFSPYQLQQTKEGALLLARLISENRSSRAKFSLERLTYMPEAIEFAKGIYSSCKQHQTSSNLFFKDEINQYNLCEKCYEEIYFGRRKYVQETDGSC